MHILIYGANGDTGARLVDEALRRGHTVRASAQTLTGSEKQADGLEWVVTDLMERNGPAGDMAGIEVVINAAGIDAGSNTVLNPPPLHTEGTRNVLAAMYSNEVDRLITISASFVETMSRGPIWFEAAARFGLASIFQQMGEMEKILQATPWLRWTAVRPGWLLDEAASGDFQVFHDVIPEDLIRTRTGDLAVFMLECAEQDLHIRATPAIARPEPADKSGPDAVFKAFLG